MPACSPAAPASVSPEAITINPLVISSMIAASSRRSRWGKAERLSLRKQFYRNLAIFLVSRRGGMQPVPS